MHFRLLQQEQIHFEMMEGASSKHKLFKRLCKELAQDSYTVKQIHLVEPGKPP